MSEQQCWVSPYGMEALESKDVGLHLTGSYYSIGIHAQKKKKSVTHREKNTSKQTKIDTKGIL